MAIPKETIWEIEPHTIAKHEILRRYFEAWLPIMATWNGRVVFIDGFAGPGRYKGGAPGSPLIAINAALNHKAPIKAEVVFLFIENRGDRHEHLQKELAALSLPPNFKVAAHCGNFDDTLTGIMDDVEQQRKVMAPTLAFIDPFGFSQTPFSVVKRLLSNHRSETLITFMYEAMNRFLEHPDHAETYDALFGTLEWRTVLRSTDPAWRRNRLHDIYKTQLQKRAGARYVRSFEMRDKGNRTEYFLFFATNHPTGMKRMKEAMWKVDPAGRFQFSDATDPRQPVLFQLHPDFSTLERHIRRRFGGKPASIEDIEAFVVQETPFTQNHYKQNILRRLELSDPPHLEIVEARPKRRRGTFPPGTVVRFLSE